MPRPATRDACPICGSPADPAHRPFCSKACRDRDLLNWLGEDYRVPGRPVDPTEDHGLDSPETRD